MKQYTESKSFKFSKIQLQSIKTLESFGVNISQFVRLAIKEKIKRDWKTIKESKQETIKLPF